MNLNISTFDNYLLKQRIFYYIKFKLFTQQRIKFEQEALEAHNRYRALHGAPKMTLNREICNIAQKWADHLAAEKVLKHTKYEDRQCSKGGTGENCFQSGASPTGDVDINGAIAVDLWYAEIKDYDYDNPGFAMTTGIYV